jgi:hypothetical protein
MLPSLRVLAARLRPRPAFWLGKPIRVTIAAAACGGYILRIHHTQGVEWIDLPDRTEAYDRPDEREFTAAAAALTGRRLVWVLPWELDECGNLTAPAVPAERV